MDGKNLEESSKTDVDLALEMDQSCSSSDDEFEAASLCDGVSIATNGSCCSYERAASCGVARRIATGGASDRYRGGPIRDEDDDNHETLGEPPMVLPVEKADPGGRGNTGTDGRGFSRRPPARTKSGEGLVQRAERQHVWKNPNASSDADGFGCDDGCDEYVVPLPRSDDDDDNEQSRPASRRRERSGGGRRTTVHDEAYREAALKRNSARRQRSSDMLGAMREATRNLALSPPQTLEGREAEGRALGGLRRRQPRRSGSGLPRNSDDGDDPDGNSDEARQHPVVRGVVRKPPARTKSGDGLLPQKGRSSESQGASSPPGTSAEVEGL